MATVTFLHTGDWQIGMTRRWLHGEAQARFAAARTEVVRRLGEVARDSGCEFVVVSGDVFETNQVSHQTVRRALEALREVPVPVYLLPGNHDPLGAGSVYDSPVFVSERPPHVHVLSTPGPHPVRPGVELVAAPWFSKHPGSDLVAEALAQAGPADGTLRVVVGHGAVDVLDPRQGDPATIATPPLEQALASGRVHYVALGDRHSRTEVGPTGAIWYAGAPEVTSPREQLPGDVLVVRAGEGRPEVTPRHVGRWAFRVLTRELGGMPDIRALDAELDAVVDKERTVVRLALRGVLDLREDAELARVLERHADLFASVHLWERHTALSVAPEPGELSDLGLGGFVAEAAAEIAAAAGPAGGDPHDRATDEPEQEPDPDLAPQWRIELDADQRANARDALALLYRIAGEGSGR